MSNPTPQAEQDFILEHGNLGRHTLENAEEALIQADALCLAIHGYTFERWPQRTHISEGWLADRDKFISWTVPLVANRPMAE